MVIWKPVGTFVYEQECGVAVAAGSTSINGGTGGVQISTACSLPRSVVADEPVWRVDIFVCVVVDVPVDFVLSLEKQRVIKDGIRDYINPNNVDATEPTTIVLSNQSSSECIVYAPPALPPASPPPTAPLDGNETTTNGDASYLRRMLSEATETNNNISISNASLGQEYMNISLGVLFLNVKEADASQLALAFSNVSVETVQSAFNISELEVISVGSIITETASVDNPPTSPPALPPHDPSKPITPPSPLFPPQLPPLHPRSGSRGHFIPAIVIILVIEMAAFCAIYLLYKCAQM
jgi:hypothetical protein